MGCPDETLFLSVSVRVFVDDTGISISGLSKVNCPLQCRWALLSLLKAWTEQRAEERGTHPFFLASLLELWHLTSSSPAFGLGCTSLDPLVLKPLNLDWNTLLAFLGLQVTDSRLWGFLASIIMWASSSKYTSFVSCWFCFSGEPCLLTHAPSPFQTPLKRPVNKGRGKYQDWNCPKLELNFTCLSEVGIKFIRKSIVRLFQWKNNFLEKEVQATSENPDYCPYLRSCTVRCLPHLVFM